MKSLLMITALMSFSAYAAPTPPASDSSGCHIETQSPYTRNDIKELSCKRIMVIFARGNDEPGNVGMYVGPPLFSHLEFTFGEKSVAVQGVDYKADLKGCTEGDKDGAEELARLANESSSKCPESRIILSGYGQGAQLVHLGTEKMAYSTLDKVAAVILIKDPKVKEPIKGIAKKKVKKLLSKGDTPSCSKLAWEDKTILRYATAWGLQVADFVEKQVKPRCRACFE